MAGMGWEGFSHPTGRLPLPVGTLWWFTKESRVRVYLTSHGVFPAKAGNKVMSQELPSSEKLPVPGSMGLQS